MLYAGESPRKIVARVAMWEEALRRATPTKDRPALCLTGGCGDIRVLKTLGVESECIVTVDTSLEAIEAARLRHPTVRHLHMSADDVLNEVEPIISMLDFCKHIDDERYLTVGMHAEVSTVVGVVFSYGRTENKTYRGFESSFTAALDCRWMDRVVALSANLELDAFRFADKFPSCAMMGNYIGHRTPMAFALYDTESRSKSRYNVLPLNCLRKKYAHHQVAALRSRMHDEAWSWLSTLYDVTGGQGAIKANETRGVYGRLKTIDNPHSYLEAIYLHFIFNTLPKAEAEWEQMMAESRERTVSVG